MTDEQYPFDYEPTQPATFKDLYPENDYSGMIAGRRAQDVLPAARDYLSPQPSMWQALTTPRVAGNPMSSPLANGLNGLANLFPTARPAVAANQAMYNNQFEQQHQLQYTEIIKQNQELAKKREDRQGAEQFGLMLQNAQKMPPGAMRKYGINAAAQFLQKTSGQAMDPEFLKLLHGANDEELANLTEFYQNALKNDPTFGGSNVSALINNPQMATSVLAHQTERMKVEAEQGQMKTMADTVSKALSGPQAPSGAAPAPAMPAQPQTAPKASLKPADYLLTPEGQKVQQFVVQKAQALGLDPAVAQALIHQESGWDPQATSPTGVVGLAQVTNATGGRYGQTDATRTNPIVSANAGLTYLSDLVKQNGGNVEKALAQYNGGSDPNYVQNVMQHVPLYGGKAAPQGLTAAPPEYQQELVGTNTQLSKIEAARTALAPYAVNKAGKAMLEELNRQHDDLVKKKEGIEKRFATPVEPGLDSYAKGKTGVPFNELPQAQQDATREAWKREQAGLDVDKNAAIGREATDRKPLENAQFYLDENKKRANVSTVGQLVTENDRRAKAGLPPLTEWTPLEKSDKERRKELETTRKGLAASDRVLKYLDKPEVSKLVGSLLSNPEGNWQRRAHELFGTAIPQGVTEIGAELADLTSDIVHSKIGGAQTVTEFGRLKPLFGDMNTVDAKTLKARLGIIHNTMADHWNSELQSMEDNYVLAPRGWKPVDLKPTTLTETTAPGLKPTFTPPPGEADARPNASQLPTGPEPQSMTGANNPLRRRITP